MQTFCFTSLPYELQRTVISYALANTQDVSPVALLLTCKALYDLVLPLLYTHVHLSSIQSTLALIEGRTKKSLLCSRGFTGGFSGCPSTRRFTFTLIGVPGGSTRGGRESAPPSPKHMEEKVNALSNERLLLAAKAIMFFPSIEHCSFYMFGVRHSTLLTSSQYLTEESDTFSQAISQLRSLKSFSWVTPTENVNFVGLSVAVVDLAIAPLVEGLTLAALDMGADGSRVRRIKGDLERFSHPIQSIKLHHCIFPMSTYTRDSLFQLFTQVHPDDEDWALFPHLQTVGIKSSTNVNPRDVAYLALFWQLRLDQSMRKLLTAAEKYQLETCPDWNPIITLSDVFENSIWGPRVAEESIRRHIEDFVEEAIATYCGISQDNGMGAERVQCSNPYINALEKSESPKLQLSLEKGRRLSFLSQAEKSELVCKSLQRVQIHSVAGAIAGVET